jgi:hypothetical protein
MGLADQDDFRIGTGCEGAGGSSVRNGSRTIMGALREPPPFFCDSAISPTFADPPPSRPSTVAALHRRAPDRQPGPATSRMTRQDPRHAPARGCTRRGTVSPASCGRVPSAPVPGQDRGAASRIDESYHHPKQPQLGLPGNRAGVMADVDGECGEREASGDCAQRQAADHACCQATSPRGHGRISVVPPGPRSSCQPGVNACAYFVVDLREEGLHYRVAVLGPQLSVDFGSGADVVWRQRRGAHGWSVAVKTARARWPRRRHPHLEADRYGWVADWDSARTWVVWVTV